MPAWWRVGKQRGVLDEPGAHVHANSATCRPCACVASIPQRTQQHSMLSPSFLRSSLRCSDDVLQASPPTIPPRPGSRGSVQTLYKVWACSSLITTWGFVPALSLPGLFCCLLLLLIASGGV